MSKLYTSHIDSTDQANKSVLLVVKDGKGHSIELLSFSYPRSAKVEDRHIVSAGSLNFLTNIDQSDLEPMLEMG